MAKKAKINTDEAVSELKKLVQEFVNVSNQSKETANTFVSLQQALNSISSSSSDSSKAFKQIETQLKNTQKSQRSFVTQTKNLKQQLALLTAQNQKLALQLKASTDAQKKKTKALSEAEKITKQLAIAKKRLAVTNSQEYADLIKTKEAIRAKNRELLKTNQATKRAGRGFRGLFLSVRSLITAFGLISAAQIFGNILKDAYGLIKTFDSLQFALERVTGSVQDAADSQRFLTNISKEFGVELVATTERWIKFLAAAKQSGITLRDTENIFRTMAKVSGVLGLQTHELTGIYLALEQMISKGKVTTEELRRQLGERLPGAMGIMAASMGVTISELDKMMKKGEVLSAEVLPGFAEAVELAYSLDTVETIETLVAEQNRLTTAWQLFVKSISEGDSVIKRVLGGILKEVTKIIEQWEKILQSDEQRIDSRITAYTKVVQKQLNESFSKELGRLKGYINEEKKLLEERDRTRAEFMRAVPDDKASAEQDYSDALKALGDFRKERDNMIKEYAKSEILSIRAAYEEDVKLNEDLLKRREALSKRTKRRSGDKGRGALFSEIFGDDKFLGIQIKNFKDLDKVIEQSTSNLVVSTTKWQLYKKIVEESGVVLPTIDEPGSGAKQLKDLKDLELDIQNERLEQYINLNEARIKDEEGSILERQMLLRDNADFELAIINNNYKKRLQAIDKMKASEYVAEQDGLTFKEYIEQEKTLAKEKALTKAEEIEIKHHEKLEGLIEKHTKFLQRELEGKRMENMTKYYEDLEKLRKQYENQNSPELKEREAGLKFNLDIENLNDDIEVLEALIELFKFFGINVADLQLKLAKAKAELAGLGDEDPSKVKTSFKEILEMVQQFSTAITDIFDAQFSRRIENINAEIEAERDKYDKLIELAEGDEAQRDVLRRNKERKIRELEKKRLKEEQKQARLRKAQAVVDIAINTAIGISDALKKSFLGIPLVPVIAALGALQIAAVLSQPIPQYKEGLDRAKKDHLGVINDGGKQEYIERGGEILTTKKKNAVVSLKTGDTVYKDYDSLISNSALMSSMVKGLQIKETSTVDDLIIKQAIIEGFKKAKVNNKNIINVAQQNSYIDRASRWN